MKPFVDRSAVKDWVSEIPFKALLPKFSSVAGEDAEVDGSSKNTSAGQNVAVAEPERVSF